MIPTDNIQNKTMRKNEFQNWKIGALNKNLINFSAFFFSMNNPHEQNR